MTSRKKRPSTRPPRTAIVPRVVFQTVVAAAVVPTMGAVALGCGTAISPTTDAGYDAGFSVIAPPPDAGRDANLFAVAVPIDSGQDSAFSVAAPLDSGFSVAVPVDDGGFSVLVAPFDANTSS